MTDLSALEQAVSVLENELANATPPAGGGSSDDQAAVDALTTRVTDLEKKLAGILGGGAPVPAARPADVPAADVPPADSGVAWTPPPSP